MNNNKTILVTGATGAQGGSVARHLLASGKWRVRCLTRNPASDKADALRGLGAEVAGGDLADPASLRAALAGCHGVFGVTSFWEHFDAEYGQGRNLIEAVAAAGIGHFVFSSLPPAGKISGGELPVPHFDAKARLEEEARAMDLPLTAVHAAFYYENFLHFFPPRRQEGGRYVFGFPQGDTPLAAVCVEDVGGVVAAIFARRDEYLGRTVGVVGAGEPPARYAAILADVLGKPVAYQHVPRDVFAALGFPGAGDLANMFEFNRRFLSGREKDLEECLALYPRMQRFAGWAAAHREDLERALLQ